MILIDFSGILHRAVHTSRTEMEDNIGFVEHKILTMVKNVVSMFGGSKQNPVVLAIDSKPTWRAKFYQENKPVYPEYENETYKGKRTRDESIPWDEIYEMNNKVLEALKLHSDYHVVAVEECEADDIIAVLAKDCFKRKETCWIVSSDKDFKQLQNEPYVTIYDPLKQAFVPQIDVVRFKEIHCMIGDKSDNILAIKPRLGEKTAEKLYPMLTETLATNPDMREKYKFNQNLIDFDFIPENIQINILENWNKQEHSFDGIQLIKVFKQYGLNSIINDIVKFKLSDEKRDTKLNTYHTKKEELNEYKNKTINTFFGDEDDN